MKIWYYDKICVLMTSNTFFIYVINLFRNIEHQENCFTDKNKTNMCDICGSYLKILNIRRIVLQIKGRIKCLKM